MKKSTPSEIFPNRLRGVRELRNLTQAQLATRSGLQPSAISHFEAGTRKPSFENLRRLAMAVEVATDYLLGRVSDPTSVGKTTDSVFRDYSGLTAEDQEIAKQFLAALAGRSKLKKKG